MRSLCPLALPTRLSPLPEMAAGRFAIVRDIAEIAPAGKRYGLRFTGPPIGQF